MADNLELQSQNNRLITEHEEKINELLDALREVSSDGLQYPL